MRSPDVLAFDDHRTDGWYLVHDAATQGVVAGLEVSRWTGTRFTATLPGGAPLCSGGHRGLLSSWWDAVDVDGAPLVEMRRGAFTSSRVYLSSGGTGRLEGRLFTRDWALVSPDEVTTMSAEPTTSSLSWRADAWAVRVHRPMRLDEVVAVVALHRMAVKAGRSAAAASAAST